MSQVFLDTSAYSAFKRGHPQLRHRIREASRILLNPVVLGELRSGFLKGNRFAENLVELTLFLASPRVVVIPVDEETAERYAVILDSLRRPGKMIPTNDIWIGAGAMQSGSALLTTDPHFGAIGQIMAELFDPHFNAPGI